MHLARYQIVGVAAVLAITLIALVSFSLIGGLVPRTTAAPHRVGIDTSSTQQWAFGGAVSASYSCSGSTCFGANVTATSNVSLSLSYFFYVEWVVIYTQTSVSSTQTMVEGQAALNVSANFHLSTCTPTPCTASSTTNKADIIVSGLVTATGFSNLTSGAVSLRHSGSNVSSSAAAIALMNSQSNESINFSGSYAFSSTNASYPGGKIGFDYGQSESSAISFSPALGIVPVNPAPGDNWTATSNYSAHGMFTAGHMYTYTGLGAISNWTHVAVSPSGSLTVNGTDLGATTLWDNYTNPHSSVTVQDILLQFSGNNFSAIDGWVVVARGGAVGGGYVLAPKPGGALSPSVSAIPTPYQSENTYYQTGPGFIGAQVGTTSGASVPLGNGATASPSVHLRAGPEPVSVAEQQYQAITAPRGGATGFDWFWLVLAVVVVAIVAAAVGVLIWRRSARRRAPPMTEPVASQFPGPASPVAQPTGPTAGRDSTAPAGMPPAQ